MDTSIITRAVGVVIDAEQYVLAKTERSMFGFSNTPDATWTSFKD